MDQLIIFLVLITVGYFSGKTIEKRHFKSIQAREHQYLHLPAVSLKNVDDQRAIAQVTLISGSTVVSVDYFKRFLATLRNLFGGRVSSYESLIDRARREAILRMKEQAGSADIILNLRLETSSVGKGVKGSVAGVEVLAYGTAITYRTGAVETPPPFPPAASPTPKPSEIETTAINAASERYDIVFSGKIAEGQDLPMVKAKLMALFKLPAETCDRMFSISQITLKKNLNAEAARKYKEAFDQTGAVCVIKPSPSKPEGKP